MFAALILLWQTNSMSSSASMDRPQKKRKYGDIQPAATEDSSMPKGFIQTVALTTLTDNLATRLESNKRFKEIIFTLFYTLLCSRPLRSPAAHFRGSLVHAESWATAKFTILESTRPSIHPHRYSWAVPTLPPLPPFNDRTYTKSITLYP